MHVKTVKQIKHGVFTGSFSYRPSYNNYNIRTGSTSSPHNNNNSWLSKFFLSSSTYTLTSRNSRLDLPQTNPLLPIQSFRDHSHNLLILVNKGKNPLYGVIQMFQVNQVVSAEFISVFLIVAQK